MFKNLYVSATFMIFSCASLTASPERITTIQETRAHLENAQKDIIRELHGTQAIAHKTLQHFQNKLGDSYHTDTAHVLSLLKAIVESNEWTVTLDRVTDSYVDSIINQGMNFNDITIDSAHYPLENKINAVLSHASPALNDHTAQMFNVFFVTMATIRSSQLLCEKLDLKKNVLLSELAALEGAH